MKKLRVFGHTEVTVSVAIEVDDDDELDEDEIYARAEEGCFAGNGGTDKLIGVYGWNETIAADNEVVFDDYAEDDYRS